ncbi:hypothetical protein RF11_14964 [Thelohanellus kitauei]|uniref:Tc1-like transposase DDE domain-containing protein n=1 Tax=Thelohanellus kitauei TaxID=669202 RepID=A0A0C2IZ55_THEKT|nr:hypothetical protein RF11_14964 [Thelohanellus kitauei]
MDEDCSTTLNTLEIKHHEWFGTQVCITTISKKRRNCVQTINIRFEYILKFLRLISIDESKIIFMDETGFNISMRSIYGRSPRSAQPTKIVKSIRSKNISMSYRINTNKMIHYELLDRAYNRENYEASLSNLFSKLAEMNFTHCTFIMDNITAFRHLVLYLPPCSPFINPKRRHSGKIKANVRRSEPKNSEELMAEINSSYTLSNSADCMGFYKATKRYFDACPNKEEIHY